MSGNERDEEEKERRRGVRRKKTVWPNSLNRNLMSVAVNYTLFSLPTL